MRPCRFAPRSRIAVATFLVVSLAAACAGPPARHVDPGKQPRAPTAANTCRGSTVTNESHVARRSPSVTELTLTLLDRSRPTPSIPRRPGMPCRVLPTEIRYPARATGPVPLVAVAHGLDGSPRSLATLLDSWAAAGYVVAAPTFPTTKKDSSGATLRSESVAQARDLSFVITQMLERSHGDASDPLRGLIDGRHIGVAGMSLGGLGVYGLVSNTCCRDRRVSAAILMAAVRRDFPGERYEDNEVPVLLVQGDKDPGYHNSLDAYPELSPPKWFITLHGSGHSPPFEVPAGPEAPLVYAATTSFWDRYLKGGRSAADRIVSIVRASHRHATLERALR